MLLDTHALIWLLTDDRRLGSTAREAVLNPANEVFVSIVSLWEMAVKIRIGKLTAVDLDEVFRAVIEHGLNLLSLELPHLSEMLRLPRHAEHRDPFDHQLVAQALVENLIFVTNDHNARRYDVQLLGCSE